MGKDIKVGDLVRINQEDPAWEHLLEKPSDHPLKEVGIVLEVRETSIVVNFSKYQAFLKERDLLKVS